MCPRPKPPTGARPESVARCLPLVGPTASGKTAVAQRIAEQDGCAILSADSMLVYRDMDIGTAKPTAEQRRAVPYYGIDLISPDRTFSVAEYCRAVMDDAAGYAAAGKPLLLVGGTGLYVKALTQGLDPAPAGDPVARQRWERVYEQEGVEGLCRALARIGPALYKAIRDKRNPRRLLRALEMAEAGQETGAEGWRQRPAAALAGLRMPVPLLHARIEARVRDMYANGLLEEADGLRSRYGTLSRTARQAIGYAEAFAALDGHQSVAEAMQATMQRTRQLARRQRTWFRHQARVEWIDVTHDTQPDELAERVREVWRKIGPADIGV